MNLHFYIVLTVVQSALAHSHQLRFYKTPFLESAQNHHEKEENSFLSLTPTTLSLEMVFVSGERTDLLRFFLRKKPKTMETVMREQNLSAVSISVTSQDLIFMS